MTDPTGDGGSGRPTVTRLAGVLVPVVLSVVVGVFAFVSLRESDGDTPEPLAVTADGPTFDDIGQMVDAVDLVVTGTIVSTDSGRTLTDPGDPTSGIVTRLYRLDVDEVLIGDDTDVDTDVVVIEQEASLLDGTPIVVNGAAPIEIGDRGVWFLVGGAGEEFPYHAVVNEQGYLPFDDDGGLVSGIGTEDLDLDDLRDRVGGAEPGS